MPRTAELKDQVNRIWLTSFHTDLAIPTSPTP